MDMLDKIPFLGITTAPRIEQGGGAGAVQRVQRQQPSGLERTLANLNGELSPSIEGGTTAINGPELRGGVSGKKFDMMF